MARSVQLPDGQVIEGVPDDIPNGVVYERAIQAGIYKPDLSQYGGYPEEQGFGNQLNIGAGKFFADRIPGMDNSAPLPNSTGAAVGYALPAVVGSFAVPGGAIPQALYGGATALRKGGSAGEVLKSAAWSGGLAGALNMAGRVATAIRGAKQSARTVGEALNSNPIKRLETGIQSAGGLDFLAKRRQIALNRSVAASFGSQADELAPEVLSEAANRIGSQFEALVPKSGSFEIGPAKAILADLDNLGPDVKAVLPEGDTITGQGFKNLRRALDERASRVAGKDGALADDIRAAITKMDEAMIAKLGPEAKDAYRQARELWKNLKIAEHLRQVAKDGNVTTAALTGELASQRGYGTTFLRDKGKVLPATQQMFDTVRDLNKLKAPVGDSGTATRAAAMGTIGAIGGGLYEGDINGALKYGLGAAILPYVAGRGTVALGTHLGPAGPEVLGQIGGAIGQAVKDPPQ